MSATPERASFAAVPTLTVGLPVYNGARYLSQSLDALLAQTFTDFELIISDNASTDGTADICLDYARRDGRIRYVRQPVNLGAVPNHNFLVDQARGSYFKWASHDDLYAPDLLEKCVAALDARPDVVLAHCWDAVIDEDGAVVESPPYEMDTASPSASARLRSLLHTSGGNDFYGVIRTDVLRRVGPHDTYFNADRTIVSSLCLQGPFHQVPEILYWRRDHPARASRAGNRRALAAALDPQRASRLRHPMVRMSVEYVYGYFKAIGRAPLTLADRMRCIGEVGRWLWNCTARAVRRGGVGSGEVRTGAVADEPSRPGPHGEGDAALRVATYGFFGNGNLGNEGSLSAFLAYLRTTHPGASVHCFAVDAEAVQRDHGIAATQLMTYRPALGSSGLRVRATKVASRLWDVPRTFRLMRDVDVLVVPGTGVLETQLFAQPWGMPYWLFLAAFSCRLRGGRVALVNVGAEHASHPVIRWLHRSTVRLAHYRSYRDDDSREAVRAMGVARAPGTVFPDLAFSLPAPDGSVRPGHVVIGVMAYQGAPDDPLRGPQVLRSYVAHMTQLITRLLDDGGTVSMVIGDVTDFALAEEIEARVRVVRPDAEPGRLRVSRAGSLAEIMTEMATAEVVVASRFHNVICALKTRRPTVSLGYAGKNARLLSEFGLAGFDQPMDAFDVDRLVAQIDEVRRAASNTVMEQALQRYDQELGQQFRQLSAELLGGAPAIRPEPASSV